MAVSAAAIIALPGCSFRATNVDSVFEVETEPGTTIIETSEALFQLSSGKCLVKRRNCHRSVLSESTE